MVLVLTGALVVLAVATIAFAVAMGAARTVQRARARRHVGVYRVRIGPARGRGIDGDDLDGDETSLDAARARARAHLLARDVDGAVAFVLAARDDGEWDVVDRIDVLAR